MEHTHIHIYIGNHNNNNNNNIIIIIIFTSIRKLTAGSIQPLSYERRIKIFKTAKLEVTVCTKGNRKRKRGGSVMHYEKKRTTEVKERRVKREGSVGEMR